MLSGRPAKPVERGFTYVAVLVAVALIGLGLTAVAQVWSQSAQREKEQELLFIGNQFRQAIQTYYTATKRYPRSLEELLQDKRQLTVKRHLRRVYRDPMTGKVEWGVVPAPDGGIMGIHSLSDAATIKTGRFLQRDAAFDGASKYSDWRFVYAPAAEPQKPPPAPAKAG